VSSFGAHSVQIPLVLIVRGSWAAKTINMEDIMLSRQMIGVITLGAALSMTPFGAQAFDDAKYPNLKGRWNRFIVRGLPGQASFDQTKPWGIGQEAPLTPEYKAVLEASLADQAKGGQGNYTGNGCVAYGMPMLTYAFLPLEYVITPETTYILINFVDHGRRIFTDGRDWPKSIEPTYAGYSIGKWIDTDGDGRYDTLEVETRGPFKGPRVYDGTGLPLHHDNQSTFKERIYLDKADPNILHDEVTVIDHALTRPWTVDKKYVRSPDPQPVWPEYICGENNALITIGKENYMVNAEGHLMPIKKDQPPPDLRYFKQPQK
jgi:hypothetical protein